MDSAEYYVTYQTRDYDIFTSEVKNVVQYLEHVLNQEGYSLISVVRK